MDLSNHFARLTKKLCRPRVADVRVAVSKRSEREKVVIDLEWEGLRIRGGGIDRHLYLAYLKALAEIGECIIVERDQKYLEGGLAGGLLGEPTIQRAKSELVERDAFLYHYRAGVPFKSVRKIGTVEDDGIISVLAYELQPACVGQSVFLVTDSLSSSGDRSCLIFGLGGSVSTETALIKAKDEFDTLWRAHKRDPKRCQALALELGDQSNSSDLHHIYSRDTRNRDRFSGLCETCPLEENRKVEGKFTVESLTSPISFLRFFFVSHPGLTRFELGVPERDIVPPLYFPFW